MRPAAQGGPCAILAAPVPWRRGGWNHSLGADLILSAVGSHEVGKWMSFARVVEESSGSREPTWESIVSPGKK